MYIVLCTPKCGTMRSTIVKTVGVIQMDVLCNIKVQNSAI